MKNCIEKHRHLWIQKRAFETIKTASSLSGWAFRVVWLMKVYCLWHTSMIPSPQIELKNIKILSIPVLSS
jgi:hypothetical protein